MLPSSCAQSDGRSTATGNWPASVQELINANELPPNAIDSPYTAANGAPVPWVLNTVNDRLIVSIDTTSEKYAARVAGSDLPFLSRNGNIISSEVTRSGAEQAHDALYARDGSRKLTGTMDADGNNIQGAGNIDTGSLTATGLITSGSLNVSGDVAVGGALTASSILDTQNPNRFIDPSGESILEGLTTRGKTKIGGELMLDNYDPLEHIEGNGCATKTVALDSEGNLLTCKSGKWAKTSGGEGGSVTVTGTVSHGQSIPMPKGYEASQCTFSLAYQNVKTYWNGSDKDWHSDVKVITNGTNPPTASCDVYVGSVTPGDYQNDICAYTTTCSKQPIPLRSQSCTNPSPEWNPGPCKTQADWNYDKQACGSWVTPTPVCTWN